MPNHENGDTDVILARLSVQVTHIEQALARIENEYTRLARFLPIERAVLGLISMVAVVLIGIAVAKLFGGHP